MNNIIVFSGQYIENNFNAKLVNKKKIIKNERLLTNQYFEYINETLLILKK